VKKTAKQLERHLKGLANHRRLEILDLVAKEKEINLGDIAESLNCNMKTISVHTQRLVQAGLLSKKYQGRTVVHSLSPYGEKFHQFLSKFE
jgi:DNA-binding transcriptional ArsR family regulator